MAAEEAMEASLRRMFPYKDSAPVKGAVARILAAISTAWECYEAGAVAAIFDVIDFVTLHQLPMPHDVADELAMLAVQTLGNASTASGQGKKPALENQRSSLIDRLRFEHIAAVLSDAEMSAAEDQPVTGVFARAALPPEIIKKLRSERPEASHQVGKAIKIARDNMPLFARGPGTLEGYYRSFQNVQRTSFWPGRFYIPSEATFDFLEWGDLYEAFHELGVPSNAPHAHVT